MVPISISSILRPAPLVTAAVTERERGLGIPPFVEFPSANRTAVAIAIGRVRNQAIVNIREKVFKAATAYVHRWGCAGVIIVKWLNLQPAFLAPLA